jgi:hypothetical protein
MQRTEALTAEMTASRFDKTPPGEGGASSPMLELGGLLFRPPVLSQSLHSLQAIIRIAQAFSSGRHVSYRPISPGGQLSKISGDRKIVDLIVNCCHRSTPPQDVADQRPSQELIELPHVFDSLAGYVRDEIVHRQLKSSRFGQQSFLGNGSHGHQA